jgi:hypothetical protein
MSDIQELLQILPLDRIAMSKELDQFCTAFNSAQKEMGLIKKSDQGHRHKYASIDTVLESVLPILGKYGISFFQSPISIDSGERLQTILTHVSGQYISFGSIKIIHNPDDIQSLGGGVTYTRRYACVSVLGLGQEDDDANGQKQVYEQKRQLITEQQFNELKSMILKKAPEEADRRLLLQEIYEATKTTKIEQLTAAQYGFVVTRFLK